MGKVIAVLNEKGGVAKTTTVKNLAAYLAKIGKKVLAVDLDSSANLTKCLGIEVDPNIGSIVDICELASDFKDIPDGKGVYHHEEGMDIVASDMMFLQWNEKINYVPKRDELVKRFTDAVKDKYDFILIDCPGGLGLFTQNALFASDYVVVPSEATKLSVEAMQNAFAAIGLIQRARGGLPKVAGMLFCRVRSNTVNDREIMDYARSEYNENLNVFKTYIPLSTSLTTSDVAFQSIFQFEPNSTAAMCYKNFANELLSIVEGGE